MKSNINLHKCDCMQFLAACEDKMFDLVISDPPYEFVSKSPKGGGSIKKDKNHIQNIDNAFGLTFNPELWLKELQRVSKVFNAYIWTNKNLLSKYLNFAEQNGYVWDLIIWQKTNPVPINNGHYLCDKEYCVYIREKGATFNSKAVNFDSYRTVLKHPIGKGTYDHPTVKPIVFSDIAIEISSNIGDAVLDTFMGSGTVGASAKRLQRIFYGCEIYVF